MKIALIAHDNKKADIINFTMTYKDILKEHDLVATGTTGSKIAEATGLAIHKFQSGPIGGDQQIGALVANDELDYIFFFRDPLTAQPHEPDVSALMRLCDVHLIPVATNMTSAKIFINHIKNNSAK